VANFGNANTKNNNHNGFGSSMLQHQQQTLHWATRVRRKRNRLCGPYKEINERPILKKDFSSYVTKHGDLHLHSDLF